MNWNVKSFTGRSSWNDIAGALKVTLLTVSRLKKIQDKKRIIRAKADAERAARKAHGDEQEAANILDDDHDEDVLF